ncbi:DUF1156 domain-containing protein, partial [Kyrpidia sp.]|uniref:DUF1156 domain-containing protein n=1 Tax=Kyrpidia sp. TaxID=2073077 RepID=UPI00258F514C
MAKVVTGTDRRLIEAGFPCHQVGAETQRERDTGKAPPTHRLHVWWARRPLTPSRAAILASLLPAGTDPDWFLRQLGIEKVQAMVNGEPWTLTGPLREQVQREGLEEWLVIDDKVMKALEAEEKRREKNRRVIQKLSSADPQLANHPVVLRWERESQPLPKPWLLGGRLPVRRVAADPAHVNERIEFRKSDRVRKVLGPDFSWDKEDLYGYERAYGSHPVPVQEGLTVFDPTAGGGSIPFEALRLGTKVIVNDLNPVACVILNATLDYPVRYGPDLATDVEKWGNLLVRTLDDKLGRVFPDHSPLPEYERMLLQNHLKGSVEQQWEFDRDEVVDYLYCRQVTCPHCGGEAPLLNTCWLSKEGE